MLVKDKLAPVGVGEKEVTAMSAKEPWLAYSGSET